MAPPKIPDILRMATQRVLGIDGVSDLGTWEWCAEDKLWTIRCKISVDVPEDSPVPCTTDWFVRVSSLYPDGDIGFFPAKTNGISGLFPHQYPSFAPESKPWQSSFLCLHGHLRALDRMGASTEPRDWCARLKWNFERAIKWMECAANNNLMREGEHFELPFHQPEHRAKSVNYVIVSESSDHLSIWDRAPQCGIVDLSMINENTGFVQSFRNLDNSIVRELQWGTGLSTSSYAPAKGMWMQLEKLPVMNPWQQPKTWGELRRCCPNTKIDYLIKKTIYLIPNGQQIVLLVGAPIPAENGGRSNLLHWQALLLPAFIYHYNGFRSDKSSLWKAYRMRNLGDSHSLPWIKAENWHQSELATRGQLPEILREMKTRGF